MPRITHTIHIGEGGRVLFASSSCEPTEVAAFGAERPMRVPPGQGPYKFSLLGMVQGNLMGLRHTHIHAYDMMASGLTPDVHTQSMVLSVHINNRLVCGSQGGTGSVLWSAAATNIAFAPPAQR